jgi:hypothetical protein
MSFAVSILVKATATLALALTVARCAPRTRAAARHVLLAAAFAILLVLPIASMLAPPLRITLPIPLQRGANPTIADSMFTRARRRSVDRDGGRRLDDAGRIDGRAADRRGAARRRRAVADVRRRDGQAMQG